LTYLLSLITGNQTISYKNQHLISKVSQFVKKWQKFTRKVKEMKIQR